MEKDGWHVTHDPFPIRVGRIGYEVDFGAEKLIAAEKGNEKIAVELKNFEGPSDTNEFHRAMGQFNDYDANLVFIEPERTLYIAVPKETWEGFFQEVAVQRALKRNRARVITFDPVLETLNQWIK
ncbi:MAG: XisH protein [Saprospiraceae bacterium]|nr:XisH protein [Saprospiraceae bacterium]